MTGFNPYPGSYAPLPGIFGAPPPPQLAPSYSLPWLTPPMPPTGADSTTFSHQNGHQQKKQPWYMIFGKEVAKTALTVGASMAGFAVGGLPGAMIAGSASSATLSALDQQWSNGKIAWGSVLIDGALGLLPGIVGERVAKAGAGLLGKLAGKNVELAAKGTLKRGMIVGATDGAVMGYAGSTATCAYDTYQKTGQVDWKQANIEGAKGGMAGAIGGGLAGGAFSALSRSKLPKSTPSPEANVKPDTPAAPLTSKPTPVDEPSSIVSTELANPTVKPAQSTVVPPSECDLSAVRTETPKPELKQTMVEPEVTPQPKVAQPPTQFVPLKPKQTITAGLSAETPVPPPEVKPEPPQRPVTLQRKPRVKPRRHSDPIIQPKNPKIISKAAFSETPTPLKQAAPQPKSILLSNKNTTPAVKTGTRVTFQEPVKPIRFTSAHPTGNINKTALNRVDKDYSRIHFKQGHKSTCYLLSPLDSMMRQPNGNKLLAKIQIGKTADTYHVKFPGQAKTFPVTEAELRSASGVRSANLDIPIIEQAYLKAQKEFEKKPTVSNFRTSQHAMRKMFSNGVDGRVEDLNFSLNELGETFTETAFSKEDVLHNLKHYLGTKNAQPNHLDVMTAVPHKDGTLNNLKFKRQPAHYYSVRLNESNAQTIVLADPYDTQSRVYHLPVDRILDYFNVYGNRIQVD